MVKTKVEARKLKGFRDYLPKESSARQAIIDAVQSVAKLAGFQQIDTPALEYCDVLLGAGGDETDKEVYRFTDHGDRQVALRFDLTVPFARYITENYNELVFPFKKLQIGEVWRGEKPQKGRYRQFCQADLDIIGADSLQSDVEVITPLFQIVDRLLPVGTTFTMALNHRKILSGLIRHFLKISDTANEQKVLIAIDKLQKIGQDAVTTLIVETGVAASDADALLTCLNAASASNDPWTILQAHLSSVDGGIAELQRFQALVEILQTTTKGSKGMIKPVFNVARGLGYYTGIVFETTIDSLTGFGSVSSGGRYNNLVARFGKHDLSGVGGSIGVDRLLAALEELRALPECKTPKVFIAIATEDATSYAFSLLNSLRKAGIASEITLKTGKLGNQFKYADKLKIPYVITVGSEEASSKTFSIKTLKTGDERKAVPQTELLASLK